MTENTSEITIIGSVANNNVVGSHGNWLFHNEHDEDRYNMLTSGSAMILGRKASENFPPRYFKHHDRKHIVLSNDELQGLPSKVLRASSMDEALEKARGSNKIFIAGGPSTWAEFLDMSRPHSKRAHYMEITKINLDYEGDVFFPDYDTSQWRDIRQGVSSDGICEWITRIRA